MSQTSDLHTYPDAADLLDAAIEFLAGLAVADEHAFHLRVALNALGIVRRELESGAEDEAAHRERLAELGFTDDADLASALRAGQVPSSLLAPVRAALLARSDHTDGSARNGPLWTIPSPEGTVRAHGDQDGGSRGAIHDGGPPSRIYRGMLP
jgi:hypothetical protein